MRIRAPVIVGALLTVFGCGGTDPDLDGMANLTITPQRLEAVDFSDPLQAAGGA